jgi:hypothetical protein
MRHDLGQRHPRQHDAEAQDHRHKGKLTHFDAKIEREERQRDVCLRQANLRQCPSKPEPVRSLHLLREPLMEKGLPLPLPRIPY